MFFFFCIFHYDAFTVAETNQQLQEEIKNLKAKLETQESVKDLEGNFEIWFVTSFCFRCLKFKLFNS